MGKTLQIFIISNILFYVPSLVRGSLYIYREGWTSYAITDMILTMMVLLIQLLMLRYVHKQDRLMASYGDTPISKLKRTKRLLTLALIVTIPLSACMSIPVDYETKFPSAYSDVVNKADDPADMKYNLEIRIPVRAMRDLLSAEIEIKDKELPDETLEQQVEKDLVLSDYQRKENLISAFLYLHMFMLLLSAMLLTEWFNVRHWIRSQTRADEESKAAEMKENSNSKISMEGDHKE